MASAPYKNYTSPLRKLTSFFERSRDQWKAKCRQAKAAVKRLKNRLRRLEARNATLQARVQELEAQVAQQRAELQAAQAELDTRPPQAQGGLGLPEKFETKPERHTYSVGHIELFIKLVLEAANSLRGAAQAMEVMVTSLELELVCPTWSTGRLWLLRLGYYKLTREKVLADDWVWLVDYVVQSGVDKCLVILGARLSELPPDTRVLEHAAVELIELAPVQQANQEVVYRYLEQAATKTGVPREIVSDHESDVKAGIERFCRLHPHTSPVYDIKHKTAALLKRELEHDPAWLAFTQHAAQTKRQLQQTALAPLAPPTQKSKARYLNVEPLVAWGQAALAVLDQPAAHSAEFDPQHVQTKLGWLADYRTDLPRWNELLQVAVSTESLLRQQGLHAGAQHELEKQLRGLAHTAPARRLRRDLLDFVGAEASQAQPGERLVGSSEVIESVFGKQKRLEQAQSSSGFTGLLLGIGAMVAATTQEVIQHALETVTTQQVLEWCKKTLGRTVQAKRREALAPPNGTEQKRDRLVLVT